MEYRFMASYKYIHYQGCYSTVECNNVARCYHQIAKTSYVVVALYLPTASNPETPGSTNIQGWLQHILFG